MPFVDVLFSDFVPDRQGSPWPDNPGYLVQAENVRPTPNGYRNTYLDATAAATPATVGAVALTAVGYARTSNPRHYVGSAAALWESDDYGAVWNDNSGTAYTASDWDFALFESTVIAVNFNNPPQEKDLTDADTTNFADLAGSPPNAARIARVRDHIVLGNTSGGTFEVRWNAIGDPTNWPTPGSATALATQAGSELMQSEHGQIAQIVGGEKYGLVFQERAITRMTYRGGNVVYEFDTFEIGQGTGYNHSAIRVGAHTYFLNSSGVYRTDGYSVEPLSLGQVDDALIRNLLSHPEGAASFDNGVAYDHRLKAVCWPFNVSGAGDYLLCYFIPFGRFAITNLTGTMLSGTLHSTHDGASQQNAFQIPHCINEDNKLMQFDNLSSIPTAMRTGYVELEPGAVSEVTGIEILGAKIPAAPTVGVKGVMNAESIDLLATGYTTATESTRSSQYRVRETGRFHSFKYTDSAQNANTLARGYRVYYEVRSKL